MNKKGRREEGKEKGRGGDSETRKEIEQNRRKQEDNERSKAGRRRQGEESKRKR